MFCLFLGFDLDLSRDPFSEFLTVGAIVPRASCEVRSDTFSGIFEGCPAFFLKILPTLADLATSVPGLLATDGYILLFSLPLLL